MHILFNCNVVIIMVKSLNNKELVLITLYFKCPTGRKKATIKLYICHTVQFSGFYPLQKRISTQHLLWRCPTLGSQS